MTDSPSTPRLTLRKGEKLRHRSLVEPLFRGGESLYAYPLRIVWRRLSADELKGSFRGHIPAAIGPLQMLITVPKKKRRHAVDRVLMRRRIREAYRLNRFPLRQLVTEREEIRTLSLSIIYIADRNEPSSIIHSRLKKLLGKLEERLAVCEENSAK